MAFRGTVPVTSEVVGAGAAAAGADSVALDPHPALIHAAIVMMNVIVRINREW
jgi:hypothetical protein